MHDKLQAGAGPSVSVQVLLTTYSPCQWNNTQSFMDPASRNTFITGQSCERAKLGLRNEQIFPRTHLFAAFLPIILQIQLSMSYPQQQMGGVQYR